MSLTFLGDLIKGPNGTRISAFDINKCIDNTLRVLMKEDINLPFSSVLGILMKSYTKEFLKKTSASCLSFVVLLINDPEKSQLVKSFVRENFPYKYYFSKDPKYYFENLKNHSPKVITIPFSDSGYKYRSANSNSLPPPGQVTMMINAKTDYEEIDLITDLFQEPVRVKCKVGLEKQSPYDVWKNRLCSTYSFSKSDSSAAKLANDRMYLEKVKECTLFKVTFARWVIKELLSRTPGEIKNKIVLDPCAGWGDRLISALSLGVEYYSYDPNTDLTEGHSLIKNYLSPLSRTQIMYHPFGEGIAPEELLPEGVCDLVFTSPPYFDYEKYSSSTSQSHITHPIFYGWVKGFLFVMLSESWKVLKRGGYIAIHYSDLPHTKNSTDIMNCYLDSFPDSQYETTFFSVGSSEYARPVWVWKKIHQSQKKTSFAKHSSYNKYF